MMPNSSDLTTFKDAGIGGLNFTFAGGITCYHTAEDTPANLDPRTLQHQGENALAMARQLGHHDLDNPKRADVIYASILSRIVVSYSKAWVVPLALIGIALFIAVVSLSIRTGLIEFIDLAATTGVLFTALWTSLLTTGILVVMGIFWSVLHDPVHGTPIPWQKYDVAIVTGCALVAATITLFFEHWAGCYRPFIALWLGALFWWLVLSLVTVLWLPVQATYSPGQH